MGRTKRRLPPVATQGDIARLLDVPPHRVRWIALSKMVPHVQRAGRVKLYDRRGQAAILAGLDEAKGRPRATQPAAGGA